MWQVPDQGGPHAEGGTGQWGCGGMREKSTVHLFLCMVCELSNSEKAGCFQGRNRVGFYLHGCVDTCLFPQMS